MARIGLLLIGLMWVLPFLSVHHMTPIPSFYGEWAAAMLGLAALAILLRRACWQPFEIPLIALLPLGLVGLIVLQLALGLVHFPRQALLGTSYLLWAFFLMALGNLLRRELGWERFALVLAWSLVAGGVLSAAAALLQQAGMQGWPSRLVMVKLTAQSYGNLGQANHFADYMALALVALTYADAKRRIPLTVFVVLAGVFLFMLALSGSRSSWLYLGAMALLALMQRHSTNAADHRRLLMTCLWLLPAFALLQQVAHVLPQLSGWNSGALPTERLYKEVGAVSVRLQIWHEAWRMFLGAPWFGIGFGQFDWGSFQQAAAQPEGTFVQPAEHAHNLVLHLLAEMGMFAGLLIVAAPLLWLRRFLLDKMTLEAWWLLALLAILSIHSMLEYPLWYTYFLGIAAVLLGAGEGRVLRLDLHRLGRPAFAAMLLLGVVIVFTLRADYATLESWMQRGLQGRVSDRELPELNRALLKIHRESLLSPFVELVYASSIVPSTTLLDEKLQLNASAMRFSPVKALVYRHALLLALKGEQGAALAQLQDAMRAYPDDVRPFVTLLEGFRQSGRNDFDFLITEARKHLKE